MSDAQELAARALKHFNEGTTDQAPSQMQIPVTAYTDEAQFQAERQAVFFESPIAVALSLEIPKPGDFLTQTIMGKPLLFTRDKEGVLHCFINVCRHRGAKVCAAEKGHQSRFSCPYHAWTYSNKGELIGVYGEDSFGEVDRASMGLAELPCDERSGVIFACLTPGKPLDLDNWLGEFAEKLAHQNLEQWHLYTERFLSGAGWKATLDGYLRSITTTVCTAKRWDPTRCGNLWCTIPGAHTNGWSLPEKISPSSTRQHLRTGRRPSLTSALCIRCSPISPFPRSWGVSVSSDLSTPARPVPQPSPGSSS